MSWPLKQSFELRPNATAGATNKHGFIRSAKVMEITKTDELSFKS